MQNQNENIGRFETVRKFNLIGTLRLYGSKNPLGVDLDARTRQKKNPWALPPHRNHLIRSSMILMLDLSSSLGWLIICQQLVDLSISARCSALYARWDGTRILVEGETDRPHFEKVRS